MAYFYPFWKFVMNFSALFRIKNVNQNKIYGNITFIKFQYNQFFKS